MAAMNFRGAAQIGRRWIGLRSSNGVVLEHNTTYPPTFFSSHSSAPVIRHDRVRSEITRSGVVGLGMRYCSSSSGLAFPLSCINQQKRSLSKAVMKRNLTSSSGSNKNSNVESKRFDNTLKTLGEVHNYVKNHLSLDIWTINIILLGFIIGPPVWNFMKNSTTHTEDVPVDDPVEHSVRILLYSTGQTEDEALQSASGSTKSNIVTPEEDAKRILTDLLASDNVRTTASRIASGVIQSPPFVNACRVLVKTIWTDLVNDPETSSQLTTLVYTVLQHEKVYAAVKELLIQLINDEDVYKELTELVVKLGEEQEVLDATQQLLTESAHRTLNDPNVLDHSMEFATEVVGDDVVQRTGGEALRNTVGYAVQPSGGAVLMGVGTMIAAGFLHFYLSRRGGDGSSGGFHDDIVISHSQSSAQSFDTLSAADGVDAGTLGRSLSNYNHAASSFISKLIDVVQKAIDFPSLLIKTTRSSVMRIVAFPSYASEKCSSGCERVYSKLLNGVASVFSIPSQLRSALNASSYSMSVWVCGQLSLFLVNCRSSMVWTLHTIFDTVTNIPKHVANKWNSLVMVVTDVMEMRRDGGMAFT
ncbi:hypothetical protein ACHAWF_014465 [Thalassiosira exigua]